MAKKAEAKKKVSPQVLKKTVKLMKKMAKEPLKPVSDEQAWVDADTEVKAQESARKQRRAKIEHPAGVIPVESEKPGIARNPKAPKVHQPVAADGSLVSLKILSYHFLRLMERLAAEHGGSSSQALQDLKADIAKEN